MVWLGLALARQCGLVRVRVSYTVWSCQGKNELDSVVWLGLELARQCGLDRVRFRVNRVCVCVCIHHLWGLRVRVRVRVRDNTLYSVVLSG